METIITENVVDNSELQKKALVEKNKKQEKSLTKIEKEAARQLMKKHHKELGVRLAKRIKNIPLAEMTNELLQGKRCPWVDVDDEKWDCAKTDGCVKGESSQCFCSDFVNCPAINQYFKNQLVSKLMRKMQGKNEIVDGAIKMVLSAKKKEPKKKGK